MATLNLIGSRWIRISIAAAALFLLVGCSAQASGSPSSAGHQVLPEVLLGLIVVLLAAKFGGDVFARIGQPAVLGELVFGILVGNLYHFGFNGFDFIRTNSGIQILSEIGVILLLFQVGMESDIAKMAKVGISSFVVATLGVIAPFFLGWGVAALFLPHESVYVHVFIGATLSATSVGITARVLRDLGRLQTAEARIVLGAAVIDDVMGLIILAVVSGLIRSASGGDPLSSIGIFLIVFKAVVFLFGAILLGRWLSPKVFHFASLLKATDLLLVTALVMCFGLAYLAAQIELAPIVGAFAAGLILDEVHWRSFRERGEHSVEELVKPVAAFLVPVFFVRMGAEVNLATFSNISVLAFALALTVAAIFGKQICGLGVMQRGLDRLSVGIGMIPRGEVGLIFAAMGATMPLDGRMVIEPATYSAVVIMVVITTMITPPALKWSLARNARVRAQKTTDQS